MRHWAPLLVLLCVAAWTAPSARATIEGANDIRIDLTNPADAATKVTWSEPGKLDITPAGLGWDGQAAAERDGWIQTAPLAVGVWWRPTNGVHVRVAVRPATREITLANGQRFTPDGGAVYVRYSPDQVHWSTWQVLQQAEARSIEEKSSPARVFQGMIRVPNCEQTEYRELLQEYAKQDVPWKSDEEAAVRWILEKQPDFFAKHLPFIGYVQLRYELGFWGGQRISSLQTEIGWGVGGLSSLPRDKGADRQGDMSAWRFKAEENQAGEPAGPPAKQ